MWLLGDRLRAVCCAAVACVAGAAAGDTGTSGAGVRDAAPTLPHIWTVMVDDLGWNGMSFSGNNDEVQTPVVAALAKNEGVVFTSHYVYKFCSPTRASFLTGRLAGHGIQETNLGMTTEEGCNGNVTMVARKLKQAGYRTLQIGKWHQGFYSTAYTPHGRGFDTSFGFLGGGEDHLSQCHGCENSIPAPDWAAHKFSCPASYSPCGALCPDQGGVDLFCTDRPCFGQNTTANPYLYAREITRAVREAAAEGAAAAPRFAFIALHNCHQPVEAPQEFVDLYPAADYNESTYARRVYNGMHSGVEYVVANLTAELKQAGLWSHSILLFLADNGGTFEHGLPVPGSSNYPLRGHKYSYFEGGIRAASFLASPLLPRSVVGTTSDALLSVADWWPTFAALAGLNTTDDCSGAPHPLRPGEPGCPGVDGRDAWGVITGAPGARAAWRTELLLGVGGPTHVGALRRGSLKYIAKGGNSAPADGWSAQYPGLTPFTPPGAAGTPSAPCGVTDECLFDLAADPLERFNLAAAQPANLTAMRARYQELAKAAYAPNGDEAERARRGLAGAGDCDSDACWYEWEQRGTATLLGSSGGSGGGSGGGSAFVLPNDNHSNDDTAPAAADDDGGGGGGDDNNDNATCVFDGFWLDHDDVFAMAVVRGEGGGGGGGAVVTLTVANGTCGACAFTRAAGTLGALRADGTRDLALVASGKGLWVAHGGAVAAGGCRVAWDPARCNATGGLHRWQPFCKAGAPAAACAPAPAPAPRPPPPPKNAACAAMLASGYWQPWVNATAGNGR